MHDLMLMGIHIKRFPPKIRKVCTVRADHTQLLAVQLQSKQQQQQQQASRG